jgi:hypothetical protein
MTQPRYPGQFAPGQTAGSPDAGNGSMANGGAPNGGAPNGGAANGGAPNGGVGNGYGASRFDRGPRPDEAADKGQFSYETVSQSRPGAGTRATHGLAPTPDAQPASQTLAPPAPGTFRPGPPPPGVGVPDGRSAVGAPPVAAPTPGTGTRGGPSHDAAAHSRTASRAPVRTARRARLQIRHINPWTVFKFACVLAVALFFIWLLTIAALYGMLDATGAIGKINDAVTTINGPGSSPPVRPSIVFVGAMLIGAVNIILFIALSTIGSVVYNLCADLIGGIEVTLSDRDS